MRNEELEIGTNTLDVIKAKEGVTLPKMLPKEDWDSRAKKVKFIVIHCTAGFSPADTVQQYFLRKKQDGGRGWNRGGYHRIINRDGSIHKMHPFSMITYGVKNFNANSIHISYVGGIAKHSTGRYEAKDTRNDKQKVAILTCIDEALEWLYMNGKDITKELQVVGHRDFSRDKNGDGIIQSWERIKECPSFDAISEYIDYSSDDTCGLLPTN